MRAAQLGGYYMPLAVAGGSTDLPRFIAREATRVTCSPFGTRRLLFHTVVHGLMGGELRLSGVRLCIWRDVGVYFQHKHASRRNFPPPVGVGNVSILAALWRRDGAMVVGEGAPARW
jgi:hypothetical protein